MTRTDELADQRFYHADVAGRIAEIKRKIGKQETLFEQVHEGEAKLVEEGEQLKAEWTTMWASAPFHPLATDHV